MNVKRVLLLLIILVLLGLASYTAIYGLEIGGLKIANIRDGIDLGLDLAGGVYVILEANTDLQGQDLQKAMDQTILVINKRIDGLGVAEPSIVKETSKRIRVELAGINNPEEAIDLIGKTAQLQFIDPEGNELLTGKNVKNSEARYQQSELGDKPVVSLEFDKEGAKKFADATRELSSKKNIEERIIYIKLDGEIISYPVVEEIITDGKAVISGSFTLDEASNLANLIRAGALPVEMKALQSKVIGPTLGLEAFEKSIKAGGLSIIFIYLFMLILYRVPGFVASIGLTIYILIVTFTINLLGVKLTLPGIAGLVLSIGMAVDANILIFERIKEEIRNGKTIRTSIEHGFKRALTSVLDSNITTLIAGLVLYYFGIGPIKGFGVTLIIGILVSMITSIFITKYLLRLIIGISNVKNTKLYGV